MTATRAWLVPALAVVLVLAVVVVFWPALHVPFFFDDSGDIVKNPEIRQLWPPQWLTAGPPHSNALAGRPISALSFAISYAVFGLDPVAHHACNLLLHGACALLLFGLVRRTLLLPRGGGHDATLAAGLAAAVSLLWALHPLAVEPVAYAVQRTELLWSFFYLLTLYASLRALEPTTVARWTAVAIAACALGMGSKEIMVSAPLAVVAFDWVFLERDARRQRRRLYTGLAATWLVLGALLLSGKQGAVALHANDPLTSGQYLFTQGRVITRYLRLVVWPHPLALAYDWPQVTPFAEGLPYFVFVAALFGLTAWALYRRNWRGFLGACVFLLLAPSSSIIPLPTEIAAERRMYLASAAVIAMLAALLWRGATRASSRPAAAGAVATAVLGLALAVASRHRLHDYRSTLAIWEDTARKSPYHSTVRNNYARELVLAGRSHEAVPHLREAIALRGDIAAPHYLLGFALLSDGDAAGALPELREAVRIQPDFLDAHFAMGRALAALHDWAAAARAFEEALRLKPDDQESQAELAKVHNNMASRLAQQGQHAEAIEHLEEAVRLQPAYALGHLNLGNALAGGGQFDGAVREWLEAVRVAPEDARIRGMVVQRLRGLPPDARAFAVTARDDASQAVREVVQVALSGS